MKHLIFTFLLVVVSTMSAQSVPEDFKFAMQADNSKTFSKLVTSDNIDTCYEAGNSSYTILALTIKFNAKACFDVLLEKKAELEKTCSGKTPLMYASKYGRLDMVKALIKAGANVKAENYKGKTALDYAKKYEKTEVYDYLKSLD